MLAVKQNTYPYLSEPDYLATEQHSEERHEYVDGQVYAMAGTLLRHNDIALNIAFALRTAARGTPCKINMSAVKVRVQRSKAYYYPDVILSCQRDAADEYYLEHPCLIVEISSPSTEWKDFTEKLIAYQKLETLQVYLIVAQDQPQVTMFYRDPEGAWEVTRLDDLEPVLPLTCIEASLTLATIYEGVDFSQAAE